MNLKNKTWIDYLLWLLLAIGFYGIAKVSWENFTGTPCPYVLFVPICYVVLFGYFLMVLSVLVSHGGCRHYFFVIGWAIATAIALIGSIAEVVLGGGVCPTSGGGGIRAGASDTSLANIPLCFISLALLLVILGLFVAGPYRRACDVDAARRAGN